MAAAVGITTTDLVSKSVAVEIEVPPTPPLSFCFFSILRCSK